MDPRAPTTHLEHTGASIRLLPNYDELLVAFRDRTDAIDANLPAPARAAESILSHVIVRDGLVVGTWKRRTGRSTIGVELQPQVALGTAERDGLRAEVERFRRFVDRPVEVVGLD